MTWLFSATFQSHLCGLAVSCPHCSGHVWYCWMVECLIEISHCILCSQWNSCQVGSTVIGVNVAVVVQNIWCIACCVWVAQGTVAPHHYYVYCWFFPWCHHDPGPFPIYQHRARILCPEKPRLPPLPGYGCSRLLGV